MLVYLPICPFPPSILRVCVYNPLRAITAEGISKESAATRSLFEIEETLRSPLPYTGKYEFQAHTIRATIPSLHRSCGGVFAFISKLSGSHLRHCVAPDLADTFVVTSLRFHVYCTIPVYKATPPLLVQRRVIKHQGWGGGKSRRGKGIGKSELAGRRHLATCLMVVRDPRFRSPNNWSTTVFVGLRRMFPVSSTERPSKN